LGIYGEYLNLLQAGGLGALHQERKLQLKRIQDIRGNDVLVIASDITGRPEKARAPISIDYTDRMPVADQIEELTRRNIDVILETPGGNAESTEDIVNMLRNHFSGMLSFIVPGAAMSAGTIMVMAGDEILMEPDSSLGPIDAQIPMNGKWVSADACLTGLRKIQDEVMQSGHLNAAYIPILQNLSPGEIQAWQNAQDFSYELVWKWLVNGKFRLWTRHSTTGIMVTEEEKEKRAQEIADCLRNHSRWLTHSRSIKLNDLQHMGLLITDYSLQQDLSNAIRRYYTLLRMTFDSTLMYKLFETPDTQIYRFIGVPVNQPGEPQKPNIVVVEFTCSQCGTSSLIQANMEPGLAIQLNHLPFPTDNRFICPKCKFVHDLSSMRAQIESQANQRII
jgi:hypothetical protein